MKYLVSLVLIAVPLAAYASCRYHTYTGPDGKTLNCTTCCYNNNCNTTCY